MKTVLKSALLVAVVLLAGACAKKDLNTDISNTTGWNYFDEKTTNFEALEGVQLGIPTGMIPIQGGSFTVGEKDEFITAPRNAQQRNITVSSFYMDKYEITNMNWREYEHWMKIVFGRVAPELVQAILPDTTVWREEMAYNEPYLDNYYRHPAFSFYPVVGVSWEQAMAYCQWRTDRVNELTLIKTGQIQYPPFADLQPIEVDETNEGYKEEWDGLHPGYELLDYEVAVPPYIGDNGELVEDETIRYYALPYEYIRDKFVFNTEKYLLTDYAPEYGKHPKTDLYGVDRKVNRADGLLYAGYRLPTEAEWEFAAYAPIATEEGLTIEGKIYPWSGYHPRNLTDKQRGQLQANFVRGRGDYMGLSGALNDRFVITNPVDEFAPNDFGLYNMAGNVNEWVMDVYRETSNQETSEYNSFRGNIFSRAKKTTTVNADGITVETYGVDSLGRIAIEWTCDDDKRDWKDGDFASLLETNYPLDTAEFNALRARDTTITREVLADPTDILATKITKNTRVYKGGSWHDRIYWLNPSTRRFLEQDRSSSTIGFRCAMSTVGTEIDPNQRSNKK